MRLHNLPVNMHDRPQNLTPPAVFNFKFKLNLLISQLGSREPINNNGLTSLWKTSEGAYKCIWSDNNKEFLSQVMDEISDW